MNYIDAFREPAAARALVDRIREAAAPFAGRAEPLRIMEVCGSHTMAIGRYGIRGLLPDCLRLISGPGCPVCVTDSGYIDTALALAARGVEICTFGDLIHVPGSDTTLAAARGEGAIVTVCYSPLDALARARAEPGREIVFLGIGFETTVGPVVSLIPRAIAAGARNLSILTAFKLVPPALEALCAAPDLAIDAFLCPAHVSAIIGADAYQPIAARHRRPCVVAGFEPLDILFGIDGILRQIAAGEARVENQYARVVTAGGNRTAQAVIDRHLRPVDAVWRGLGVVPSSGLCLRPEFAEFDAELRHGIAVAAGREPPGCRCGDVIRGARTPPECPLFGKGCTPARPIGPCMVSSEGSCAAWYKYGRIAEAEHDEP